MYVSLSRLTRRTETATSSVCAHLGAERAVWCSGTWAMRSRQAGKPDLQSRDSPAFVSIFAPAGARDPPSSILLVFSSLYFPAPRAFRQEKSNRLSIFLRQICRGIRRNSLGPGSFDFSEDFLPIREAGETASRTTGRRRGYDNPLSTGFAARNGWRRVDPATTVWLRYSSSNCFSNSAISW